jgi:hypothetical protein
MNLSRLESRSHRRWKYRNVGLRLGEKGEMMEGGNTGMLEGWNLGGTGFGPLFQYSNTPVFRHRAELGCYRFLAAHRAAWRRLGTLIFLKML